MASGYENLINNRTSTQAQSTSSTGDGTSRTTGNGILGKDDFLKLLLVQLQHQDPTAPMDSDKILSQTSQLASLEAASNTNKAIEKMAEQMKQTVNSNATSVIGKMGSLGHNAVLLQNGKSEYEIYFPTEISSGKLEIQDKNKKVVQTIDLSTISGDKKGILSFKWDGKDQYGEQVPDGLYGVTAEYIDVDKNSKKTQFGVYPVESVRYDNGATYIKMGSTYFPISDVVEFYQDKG